MNAADPFAPPFSFDLAAVLRGLSLKERRQRLDVRAGPPTAAEVECANRTCSRWTSEEAFDDNATFLSRLAAEGISEQEFRDLGSRSPEAFNGLSAIPWTSELTDAATSGSSLWKAISDYPTVTHYARSAQFIDFCEPVICSRFTKLETAALDQWAVSTSLQCMLDHLALSLARTLHSVVERTLVLELNIYRVLNRLEGDGPQSRFAFFRHLLSTPAFRSRVYNDYPVMFRQVLLQADLWGDFALEFLDRFHRDQPAIMATLGSGGDLGSVTSLNCDAGDRHNGCRRVCLISFSSRVTIVYKPRPLALDTRFYEFIRCLNCDMGFEWFAPLALIDRGSYGWTEFVPVKECESLDEVKRFYRRMGGYVALLYLLKGTDFHYENVVANGDRPVPVDLETLLQPVWPLPPSAVGRTNSFDIRAKSVLRTNLLPIYDNTSGTPNHFDVSAIGASTGQELPLTPRATEEYTDFMRIIAKAGGHLPDIGSRPRLFGQEVAPVDYVDDLTAGFEAVYSHIERRREHFTKQLEAFRNVQIRFIPRPSLFYFRLLFASGHPDAMRDGLERDRVFGRLCLETEVTPCLKRLYAAEIRQLENGEIPAFYTSPGSRDLWTLEGDYYSDYFVTSGLDAISEGLNCLSKPDMALQRWILESSVRTLRELKGTSVRHRYTSEISEKVYDNSSIDSFLNGLGDRLLDLAIHNGNRVTWLDITHLSENRCALQPMGYDLYSGLMGCIIFLAGLHRRTGCFRHLEIAKKALVTALDLSEIKSQESIGAYSGLAGLMFGLIILADWWVDRSLLDQAVKLTPRIAALVEDDKHFDVLSGVAGALVVLLRLHAQTGDPLVLEAALKCGRYLLARQQHAEGGEAWITSIRSDKPLTGFSHGAAGIAWSLMKLWARTGDDQWSKSAQKAIRYERSVFLPDIENWPDFRTEEGSPRQPIQTMVAWCHGAPGIGLARLDNLHIWDDEPTRAEITSALHTTIASIGMSSHSLCHGDLGNLDLLTEAQERLQFPVLISDIQKMKSGVISEILSKGFALGSPGGIEVPGLMTGIAGIGYGMLRFVEPARFPSLLLLKTVSSESNRGPT